jgi:predicted DNA-binding protein
MAGQEVTLTTRLPKGLARELEQLTSETGHSESYFARRALIEFLEDRADYRRAVAVLGRERDQKNLTLEEAKRELGLDK